MPTIRGHQAQIKFYKDGNLQDVVDITRFEANQDASFIRSKYVGNPIPEGDVAYQGFTGSADLEVRDSRAEDIIDALIEQNLGGVGVSDHSISVQEFFDDGSSKSWVYFDVQWRLSASYPNLEEKVTKRMEWQAAGRVPL